MSFFLGAVTTVAAFFLALWLAALSLKGYVRDCDVMGQFRFDDKVYQCKQVKAWEGME